jgi:tRNA uracil 4-sulfurtransferase
MNRRSIVIHYGEIALKGKNRGAFEKRLKENIVSSLRTVMHRPDLKKLDARFILTLNDRDETHIDRIADRLRKIPGINSFGIGMRVPKDIDSITSAAIELFRDLPPGSFRVKTKRSDKTFALTSPEIGKRVGTAIVARYGSSVDLNNPDNTVYVEISYHAAIVYARRFKASGGLPSGISGNVLALISAGFDSPVASYLMMKRGAHVLFVHFHSYPYVAHSSIDQVEKLVKQLTDFQISCTCYMVPLGELQRQIMLTAPSHYRILLYRRTMIRLAGRIARSQKCEALVTGESLGQVASQTLRNIRLIGDGTDLPVLRPLIGMDKEEIINLSREIGTAEISSQPYDDCCSFFMPRRAETWGSLEEIRSIESGIDQEELLTEAIRQSEIYTVTAGEQTMIESI